MTTNSTIRLTAARKGALAQLAQHGTQFEPHMMCRGVGVALQAAGLIDRCPGRRGRLTTVSITEAGRALALGAQCPCYDCAKARGEYEPEFGLVPLTAAQVRRTVEGVRGGAVENCGSIDTEAYQDSVRSLGENLGSRDFGDYDAPRALTPKEAALIVRICLGLEELP